MKSVALMILAAPLLTSAVLRYQTGIVTDGDYTKFMAVLIGGILIAGISLVLNFKKNEITISK